jgi:flagellar hook protein FlgE
MGIAYDLNALSGINAATNGLGVISNNLANSQSVGFKSSRAEFADIFSNAQSSPGNGVRVEAITQDFSQGTLAGTGRELDMAIDGEGFFVLEDKSGKFDAVYTRNGSFKLDKDGFLTDQTGNKVQGYLLNETLSTETDPVFDTTLSGIELDAANANPRPTDAMTFDINLDGEEKNNKHDNASLDWDNNGVVDYSVGTSSNLHRLIDPESNVIIDLNEDGVEDGVAGSISGAYGGFPDFSTNKIINDTLGGEHRLTSNFFKRDVVTDLNSSVAADGSLAVDGAGVAYGDPGYDPTTSNAVKYTSWIAQYTVEDYNNDTGTWLTSGHRYDQSAGSVTKEAGQIFELRFDDNGQLLDVREPVNDAGNYSASGAIGIDDTSAELVRSTATTSGWSSISGQPKLDFMIDSPLTGAHDPLGNPDSTSTVSITLGLDAMTQYAGTYNIRGVSQNGYKIGDLVGLTTGLDGVIQARYSNGRSVAVAQMALANFSDKNAMEKLGGQTYAETFASGTRQLGSPQSVGLGTVNSGSLEYSNVEVAGELVNMIQTQRTYQASAQVLSTSQTLMQTILNL